MRIGMLTGGGDAPGLNAAIRAITRKALADGMEVIGFRNGWKGVLEMDFVLLKLESVSGILYRGGTILGSSRTNPYNKRDGLKKIKQNLQHLKIDALIPIGGEGTLGAARRLSQDGIPLVGVPKTIDNDIYGTDYTIGFDTASSFVMDSLDRLHPTAESHHRVMLVEVMGRNEGWVATIGGLAGGADAILIPEAPYSLAELCKHLKRRHEELGKLFSIVVVAEGIKLTNGCKVRGNGPVAGVENGSPDGVVHSLATEIEKRTGYETRVVVLGHLQRGGSPSSFDRVLAIRLGAAAVELVKAGTFGVMVGLRGSKIVPTSLEDGLSQPHPVDPELYRLADLFY